VSIGTVDKPASRDAGGYQHGKKNFFCRFCGSFTSVDERAPDPDRCTTPGCKRPFGFGTKMPDRSDRR
jgi:hypothetical protein